MLRFCFFAAFFASFCLADPSPRSAAQQPAPARSASPAAASPTPPPRRTREDEEVIKIETNLVTTPVSVLDRNGRFIAGLRKRDFTIFDNDVQQTIAHFQSEETPFLLMLMIDISPSTQYKIEEIQFAAITFINQLRPNDKVMVAAFDNRIRMLTEEPTSDKQKLYAAVYGTRFGSGTSIYDVVSLVTDMDMIKFPGRKAVVMFTDGVDTTSRQSTFESSLADAEEVDALFYTIRYNTIRWSGQQNMGVDPALLAQLPPAVRELIARNAAVGSQYRRGMSPAEYELGRRYLSSLAETSGGRMFEAENTKNLEEAFAGVAEELRRQYSIGYYPEASTTPGERRSIRIKVARPNTVIRSKRSYLVREPPKEGESAAPTTATR